MEDVFRYLSDELLRLVGDPGRGERYVFHRSGTTGEYGILYKRDYSGLMARPPRTGPRAGKLSKPKQGLFDFEVLTGTRHDGKVTHRNMFEDLLTYSDLGTCMEVWRGGDPRCIGDEGDERDVLVTMALLMFEQEVNWGSEEWQKGSNFPPQQRNPRARRPRDMIMGFVIQAFELGIDRLDDLQYWMQIKPGTVTFQSPGPTGPKYLRQHPRVDCFNGLRDDARAEALMVGDVRERFRAMASSMPDNPRWVDEGTGSQSTLI